MCVCVCVCVCTRACVRACDDTLFPCHAVGWRLVSLLSVTARLVDIEKDVVTKGKDRGSAVAQLRARYGGGWWSVQTFAASGNPFLTGRMFVRPNVLRTLRRTMIRFLIELLVR